MFGVFLMSDILVNVLFLLVMLFLTQLLLDVYKKELTTKDIKVFVFLSGLVSFIFFVFFPFASNEGMNYDIRVVPFIVASLYGGPLASFCLYICGFFVRLALGMHEHSGMTVLIYALIPLLTIFFHQPFLKANRNHKLWISIGILFIHMCFSVIINNFVFHLSAPFNIILMGAFIKLMCTVLTVWTYEKIILNHQLKNELLEMEKMEMVSHLSASVAHEIRNGLTGAKGFIQLLIEDEKDPKKQKYMDIALNELERSDSIIRDFLTFAKPAPEKIENINVEQLLAEVIDILNPLTHMNSIEVKKNLLPFSIIGERRVVQQALLNMMKNAVEAMPNGGELTISMKQHKNHYEIVIQDTGLGMDEVQIKRLGKPYFTTKGQKGTGLGLMVAYRVIQQLNGQIKVNSEKGKGTRFHIYLPCTAENNETMTVDQKAQSGKTHIHT